MTESVTILFVDDEPMALKLGKAILGEKFEVMIAVSTKDALEVTENFEPHVVVTDYKMPGEDGLILLTKIKERYPDLPVIILTGNADRQTGIGAVKGGAFDFLEKPFDDEELELSVQRAVDYRMIMEERNKYIKKLQASGIELMKMNNELNKLERERAKKK